MISTGANNAYKLPGYGFSNENLLEGSSRSLSVTAAGQLHCSGIHQQSWGIVSSKLCGCVP